MNGDRSFWFWVAFWLPAVGLVFLFARVLFREHWHELRTLRFLSNRLAPFFGEFDPPNLHKWVARCAPHVWHGWRLRNFEGLADFATPELLAEAEARFAAEMRAGRTFEGRFERVLKLHFLDLRMGGHGPAPADVELRMRVELLASDALRGPDGALVSKAERPELCQLQQFWTLRHDGGKWRLASVSRAEGDWKPLPAGEPLPGLMDWKRPAKAGDEQGDNT